MNEKNMKIDNVISSLKGLFQKLNDYCGLNDSGWSVLKLAVEALEKYKTNSWTSCDIGDPEKQGEYYVTWEGTIWNKTYSFIAITEWDGESWDLHEIEGMGYKDIKILAWMDLPDKYVKETVC